MIKLGRVEPPTYLSTEKAAELTREYKATGASVWNQDDIKTALLGSSFGKCAYCETKLDEESKYMEVEHFADKARYEDKVVEWSNLLPACKRCNGNKGTHDIAVELIINPFDDEPKEHLGFRCYRFREKSKLGKSTLGALDLNNSDRIVLKRFSIGEAMVRAIDQATERYETWCRNSSTRSKNLLLGSIEGLLLECQKEAAYAATAATILHQESAYHDLVNALKGVGLWTSALDELHSKSAALALDSI